MQYLTQVNFSIIDSEFMKDHPLTKNEFRNFGPTNIGAIINLALPYLFVIAGLILLFMLILGGIGMMLGANNEAGLKKAQGQISNALLGFLMLFISYWLVQIVEAILGITIF